MGRRGYGLGFGRNRLPPALVGDPHFNNTVLLLSGNGTPGSVTFTDESFSARGAGAVNGLNNDAQVSDVLKKFGNGSIRLDGNIDNVSFPHTADLDFGSSPFTIETWASISPLSGGIGSECNILAKWESGTASRVWTLRYRGDLATDTLEFNGSATGAAIDLTVTANWNPTPDFFHFLVAERGAGNVFRLYIDGVMVAKVTQAITLAAMTNSLRIGCRSSSGPIANLRGNVDETRITRNVARYDSDAGFVVPTTAFPRFAA